VLGTYKGPHDLRVSVATDYNETFTQVHDFDATALYASSAYGVASPYGADRVYGGAWKVYNFRRAARPGEGDSDSRAHRRYAGVGVQ
jgi:hypothetical protein